MQSSREKARRKFNRIRNRVRKIEGGIWCHWNRGRRGIEVNFKKKGEGRSLQWSELQESTKRKKIISKQIWRSKNREKVRRQQREYYQRNKEQYRIRRESPKERLKNNIKKRIKKSFRDKRKSLGKFEDILGYSVRGLAAHLEKQFTKGMSWSNYGEWHIDHIIPDCLFKYEDENNDEFKASWSLSNLRPLWREENLRKNNKHPCASESAYHKDRLPSIQCIPV